MTDHQLFAKVLGFLKQTIVYSNEEMARLDELKNLVRDRLAQPVHASDMSEKHVHESDKDRHEFEEMVKKGTKAWDGVPDDWVDDLRGGAEKQEPVAVKHMMDWVYQLKRFSNDGRYMSIPSGLSAGACYELAVEIEQFIKTAPVHASDISQEPVDETAKDRHDFEQPDLAKVGEVGVWGHQREWVGLTEGEVHDAFNFVEFIKQISFDRDRPEWCENFAAYLEAKLKEKNHG